MKVTEEELAAYADGELSGEDAERVAAAIEADPQLAAKVERHRALRASLGAHFAPILEQEVPERLSAPLQPSDNVIRFSPAREAKKAARRFPRWGWIAGPALAASLALALFVPRGGKVSDDYAGAELAGVFDRQLVAEQSDQAETRILLSFRREGGDYCRAFTSSEQSGIACRDDRGWKLVAQAEGLAASGTEFRQAGNAQADLLARAQEMAMGGALDAEGERAAREADWQD